MPISHNGCQYRALRNKINILKKCAKKNYFGNLLNHYKNDCKKSWDVINLVLNRKTHKSGYSKILSNDAMTTSKTEISEAFNHYFTSVPFEIASEIP